MVLSSPRHGSSPLGRANPSSRTPEQAGLSGVPPTLWAIRSVAPRLKPVAPPDAEQAAPYAYGYGVSQLGSHARWARGGRPSAPTQVSGPLPSRAGRPSGEQPLHGASPSLDTRAPYGFPGPISATPRGTGGLRRWPTLQGALVAIGGLDLGPLRSPPLTLSGGGGLRPAVASGPPAPGRLSSGNGADHPCRLVPLPWVGGPALTLFRAACGLKRANSSVQSRAWPASHPTRSDGIARLAAPPLAYVISVSLIIGLSRPVSAFSWEKGRNKGPKSPPPQGGVQPCSTAENPEGRGRR